MVHKGKLQEVEDDRSDLERQRDLGAQYGGKDALGYTGKDEHDELLRVRRRARPKKRPKKTRWWKRGPDWRIVLFPMCVVFGHRASTTYYRCSRCRLSAEKWTSRARAPGVKRRSHRSRLHPVVGLGGGAVAAYLALGDRIAGHLGYVLPDLALTGQEETALAVLGALLMAYGARKA